ncbi:hypothetical protein [Streptomyces sp. NBC_01483]|uniref:hypothetical protein n=1 Tax=Streptomyces sp. NBC_01483 TaxID=2903883 RepID=UPI002E347A45|nr:hypothetical protein [Streptomyces sp. NBC_01483]
MGEVAEADPAVAVGVISSCKTEEGIPHRVACRALRVSESWYYKWRDRPPTEREMRRQHLAEDIEEIFRQLRRRRSNPGERRPELAKGFLVTVGQYGAQRGQYMRDGSRQPLPSPGRRPSSFTKTRP